MPIIYLDTISTVRRFLNRLTRELPKRRRLIAKIAICLLVVLAIYHLLLASPLDFKEGSLVKIKNGLTIDEIGQILQDKNIIKFPVIFTTLTRIFSRDTGVIAGDYYFNHRRSVLTITWRLINGQFDIEKIKITIPEGLSVKQIGQVLAKKLPNFDFDKFMTLADREEGFLFPDTYFFTVLSTEEEIINQMKENFKQNTSDLMPIIQLSNRSLEEIITMASILEKEAITNESKKIISGILWKRLDEGMRLQVDAVFVYLLGKGSFDLTKKDLRLDSPYNTYRYAGLPPGPIANPGRESIEAALYPQESPFWFYLSDLDSEMHYAITHEDHVRNKNKFYR